MTLREGNHVGPYELVRRLGAGAFGEVWLVQHLELPVQRAMKIPTDPDCVRQLRQEGRIQFSLKHPNIVETMDLDTLHDPPYFVMEYVEGQDLRKLLEARGKLPVAEAIRIFRQLLDALQVAHEHGVLHRDLKPENILLTPDGTVKVSDFGLGKVQASVAQSLVLSGSMVSTEGKSVSGTFAYMSPEQQLGKDADPRDDVYALGILACELVTGSRPSAAGAERLLKRAGLDPRLAEGIVKALDEPAQRYPNAGAMLAALDAWMGRSHAPPTLPGPLVVEALPVPEPPPPVPPAPRGPFAAPPPAGLGAPRKRKGRVAAAIIGSLVALAGLAAYLAEEAGHGTTPPRRSLGGDGGGSSVAATTMKSVSDSLGVSTLSVPANWQGTQGAGTLSYRDPSGTASVMTVSTLRQTPNAGVFAANMMAMYRAQNPSWTFLGQELTQVAGQPAIHVRATYFSFGSPFVAHYYFVVTFAYDVTLLLSCRQQDEAAWQDVFESIAASWQVR